MTRRDYTTTNQTSALPLICLLALLITLFGTLAHAIHPGDVQVESTPASLEQAFCVNGPLTLQAP